MSRLQATGFRLQGEAWREALGGYVLAKLCCLAALWLVSVQGCAEAFAAPRNQAPVVDVTTFGARPNDGVDDTAQIAAAITEAAAQSPAVVYFPKGVFEVQDPTPGNHTTASSAGIYIPPTASNLVLLGYDATIKAGPNGITQSIIRCQGSNCRILGLTIDSNADNAPLVQGADNFLTKSNSGIELNGCTNSSVRNCVVLNADKSITTFSAGTIAFDFDGADNIPGNGDDRTCTLSGGTWPVWVDDTADTTNTDSAITITYTDALAQVQTRRFPIVHCPTTNTCTLLANSATNDQANPGLDVPATAAFSVTAYAKSTQGEEAFLMVGATRCEFAGCLSLDSSYTAFRVAGDNNSVTDCSAVNFRGNGLRVNEGETIYITGFKAHSTRNDGRGCVLVDAGSAQASGNLRTNQVFLDHCELYCNPDGDFDGAASALKLASAHLVHVTDCKIEVGSATNNVAVRLEDNLRSVVLDNSYIKPVILFTPASAAGSIFKGAITGHTSGTAGRVRYTVSGTPSAFIPKRELHVRGSLIDQYNGPQKVEAVGLNFIETERAFVAGTLGSATYGQTAIDSFTMKNCTVEGIIPAVIPTVSFYNYMLNGLNAYRVDIEGCTFSQAAPLDVQYGCVLTDYASDNGCSLFRFARNVVTFDSDKVCRVHRGTATQTEISTSGKTIWYANEKHNKDLGAVHWTDETNTERALLFATDGENPTAFVGTAAPTAAHVTWAVGDVIRNVAPALGEPTGWVCTAPGAPGTWKSLGLVSDGMLAAAIGSAGNTGTGEDLLLSHTLAAGPAFAAGDTIDVFAQFVIIDTARTKRIRGYAGGDLVYDSGAHLHQGGGRALVKLKLYFNTANSALVFADTSANTPTSDTIPVGVGAATAANIIAGETIHFTGEVSAGAADNELIQEALMIQYHPAP